MSNSKLGPFSPRCGLLLTGGAGRRRPGGTRAGRVAGALKALDRHDNEVIDKSQVGPWLDEIYAGSRGEAWAREVKRSRDEFVAACLADLRAFQSSKELAEAFDRMLDGTEVLSQTLSSEYGQLLEDDPLRASELLVPISSAQLRQLRRAGKVPQPTRRGADSGGCTV